MRVYDLVRGDLGFPAEHLLSDVQYFGIEVEFENAPHPDEWEWTQGMWSFVEDGSLRNHGAEYITPPVTLEDGHAALEILYRMKNDSGWQGTPRTGIHVHANCLPFEPRQVMDILLVYALMEPVLFAVAGNQRESNVFCIPWYRAGNQLRSIRSALVGGRDTLWTLRDTNKYAALNVRPITQHGTLEFRHAPTYNAVDPAHLWLDTVAAIVYRGAWTDVRDLLTRAQSTPVLSLAEELLGSVWKDVAPLLNNITEELYDGLDILRVAETLYVQSEPDRFEWMYNPVNMSPPPISRDAIRRTYARPSDRSFNDLRASISRTASDILNSYSVRPQTFRVAVPEPEEQDDELRELDDEELEEEYLDHDEEDDEEYR